MIEQWVASGNVTFTTIGVSLVLRSSHADQLIGTDRCLNSEMHIHYHLGLLSYSSQVRTLSLIVH